MTDERQHVEKGAAPAVRRFPGLIVAKLAVGPMTNNAYLLRDPATGEGLLIDAPAEPERLRALVRLEGDGIGSILITHRHPDHTGALAELVAATGARVIAGAEDADALPVAVDSRLTHGDIVQVGAVSLEIVALRGHTPGSIAVLYRNPEAPPQLFTGDSLFPGGVGRTGSAADFVSLIDDVEQRLFDLLPDDTHVAPGHGDDTTLGAERPHLPEWRLRGW